jgi:hypothetical protein
LNFRSPIETYLKPPIASWRRHAVFGHASLVQYVSAASAALGLVSPAPPPAVGEHVLALLLHLLRTPTAAAAAAAALREVLRAGGRRQVSLPPPTRLLSAEEPGEIPF